MSPILKFVIALLITFAFFLFWDRAEIASFRASTYNDSGLAAQAKGDLDSALKDFSKAIELNPQSASAHFYRGNTYQAKGDLDRAIADYNETIRLYPRFATVYYDRGNAFSIKGDFEHALADYTQVIRLHPKHAPGYANRGRAFFYAGSPAQARADFAHALALDPTYAYAAIWLDIAERRDNLPSQLPKLANQLDMTAWPAPIVKLFLGGLTVDAVLEATTNSTPESKQGQVCEANFYAAELALLDHQDEKASRLFQLALDGCPHSFVEWLAAHAELSRLTAKH